MYDLGGVLGEVEGGEVRVALCVGRGVVGGEDVVDGRRARRQRHADGPHQIHVDADETLECVGTLTLQGE